MIGIDTCFVFISGFRQNRKVVNGIFERFVETERLRLGSEFHSARCEYHPWMTNWQGIAESLVRFLDPNPTIIVVAYSWGAGWGHQQLSAALEKHGVEIDTAILCDPVYRAQYTPRLVWFNPRSLINSGPLAPRIEIRSNVRRVYWLRQFQSKPRGHDVVTLHHHQPETAIEDPIVLDLDHSQMDESSEFCELVREVAESVFAVEVAA